MRKGGPGQQTDLKDRWSGWGVREHSDDGSSCTTPCDPGFWFLVPGPHSVKQPRRRRTTQISDTLLWTIALRHYRLDGATVDSERKPLIRRRSEESGAHGTASTEYLYSTQCRRPTPSHSAVEPPLLCA